MAKSSKQKLKLLYLTKILMRNSDENHPLTVADLISSLAAYDISAERKSIYSDLEALQLFGLDIVRVKSKNTGYYIGTRKFELPELKLLVDSVQSSRFITYKKTLSLIQKIEELASVYDAQLLQRQVYVQNRVKSMNESVYYNVDEISNAIIQDKTIRFRYFTYDISKERQFRRDGAFYEASPFSLMWNHENYYMLAWEIKDEIGQLKHYRVDKMTEISITDQPRQGKEAFEKVDMSAYSKKVFGMFTGKEERIKLKFKNHLVSVVIDRFGKDITILEADTEHFIVNLDVVISPKFYAWLFGFGTDVEVLSPESVRIEAKEKASQIMELY